MIYVGTKDIAAEQVVMTAKYTSFPLSSKRSVSLPETKLVAAEILRSVN